MLRIRCTASVAEEEYLPSAFERFDDSQRDLHYLSLKVLILEQHFLQFDAALNPVAQEGAQGFGVCFQFHSFSAFGFHPQSILTFTVVQVRKSEPLDKNNRAEHLLVVVVTWECCSGHQPRQIIFA